MIFRDERTSLQPSKMSTPFTSMPTAGPEIEFKEDLGIQ